MKKDWDNEERHRYYGIRRGDIVKDRFMKNDVKGEVVEYGFMDNNAVYVQFENRDEPIKCVAEWCQIVTKVEEREDYGKEGEEEL